MHATRLATRLAADAADADSGTRPAVTEFEAIYRAHARDVYRFALFLSGRTDRADDLVSETFIRLWDARTRLDLTTVRAYLFAIARNLYLQQQRHATRGVELDDRLADLEPGPDQQIESRDRLRAVLAALQTLPEIDRAALLMRADESLPYTEIAATLGISVAAARVKVHRARLALARLVPEAVRPSTER